jgi:lysophospholipase L1-like esterase
MNVNPAAKTVLCFGDSNTYGTFPDGSGNRYPADVRWTGRLQQELSDAYYVIEEGLGGRTTNIDHPRPEKPGRNGIMYFTPCLLSNRPMSAVVIMLGTNDCKNVYNRSAKEIAAALGEYCDIVKLTSPETKVVLVAPTPLRFVGQSDFYDEGSVRRSEDISSEVKKLAQEKEVVFYDAGLVATVGPDGTHWDEASHTVFAHEIAKTLKDLQI